LILAIGVQETTPKSTENTSKKLSSSSSKCANYLSHLGEKGRGLYSLSSLSVEKKWPSLVLSLLYLTSEMNERRVSEQKDEDLDSKAVFLYSTWLWEEEHALWRSRRVVEHFLLLFQMQRWSSQSSWRSSFSLTSLLRSQRDDLQIGTLVGI